MKSAVFSFIAYLIFIGSALAVEPVDNILPFQLLDDNNQIIAEMKIYEISRQPTGKMDRPFIIIEGLDISTNDYGSFGRDDFESIFRRTVLNGGEDFWETMLDSGVDLYLVDFKSFNVSLENMATLLLQAMKSIWTNRTDGQESFRVAGASMGGLVGRLALGLGEDVGLDHHTSHFATLDSPHRGAVIPLGVQGVLQFWSSFSSSVAELLTTFQWTSVNQVLLRTMTDRETGNYLNPPATYLAFMELYQDLKPQIPETVAFSNGSAIGVPQISNPFLSPMFSFDYNPFGPGHFIVNVTAFDEYPTPVVHSENSLGFFFTIDEKEYTAALSNMEGAPGGYRNTYSQLQAELKAALDSMGYGGAPFGTILEQGQHCFIPLASSVDLPVDMSAQGGAWIIPSQNAPSSFDRIYMASENTEHVDLLPYTVPLEAELMDTVGIDTETLQFYFSGSNAPVFSISTTIASQVYYDIEVTTDPMLFNSSASAGLKNNSNFFSSWWGGSSSEDEGSVASPIQEKAGSSIFLYELPPAFLQNIDSVQTLFYRLRVFMHPDGSNRYVTTTDTDPLGASVLPLYQTGDMDGDTDSDGHDIVRFSLAFADNKSEADLNNDALVSSLDMDAFSRFFGKQATAD